MNLIDFNINLFGDFYQGGEIVFYLRKDADPGIAEVDDVNMGVAELKNW